MEGLFGKIVETYVSKFIDEIILSESVDEDTLYALWTKVSGMKIETTKTEVEVVNGCRGVFKSGKNKGRMCGKILSDGETFCKRHSNAKEDKDKTTCNHTLSNGSKCKKIVKLTEYCNVHEKLHDGSEIINCAAFLKSGEQCKKIVKEEGDKCGIHMKKENKSPKIEARVPLTEEKEEEEVNKEEKEEEVFEEVNKEEEEEEPVLEEINKEEEEEETLQYEVYEFKEEDLEDEELYERISKKLWKHLPTNYCIKKNSDGSFVVQGIFEGKDIAYIERYEEVLITGIEIVYEEEEEI